MQYNKPPLSIDEQIHLLASRGLIIPDRDVARHYLKFINYYRLSGYTFYFEQSINKKRNHQFQSDTSFNDIIALYDFDRNLRILVMDAIEKIEVAARTLICTTLAIKYQDSHWHLNKSLFKKEFNYFNFMDKCRNEEKNSKEPFVTHYKTNYKNPEDLPSWMIIELLPMGTWSILYNNLENRSDKKSISDEFNLSPVEFGSCLHAISYMRNLCAHHSRLWNRHFTLKPMQTRTYKEYLTPNTTFAAQAALLHIFLKIISPANEWTSSLYHLINKHQFVNISRMGFLANWHNDEFWEIHTVAKT